MIVRVSVVLKRTVGNVVTDTSTTCAQVTDLQSQSDFVSSVDGMNALSTVLYDYQRLTLES